MKIALGIDFGSENLTIYKKGEGVVFKEPSLLCVKKTNNNFLVVALGEDVLKIKDDDINQIIFSPLAEGVVKSVEYAALLLKYALNKVFKVLMFKNFEATIAVPCGLDNSEVEKFVKICKLAGLAKIHVVPAVLCIDRPNNAAMLMIDIGAAKADIAIVSGGEVVRGATLGLGGYNIDMMILQKLFDKHGAYFAEVSAKKIKEQIGSLFSTDKGASGTYTVHSASPGIDANDSTPHNYPVTSSLIFGQIEAVFSEVAKVANSLVAALSEDLQGTVRKNGATIVGGGSQITGCEKFFAKRLGMPCHIPDNADNAVALGFKFLL